MPVTVVRSLGIHIDADVSMRCHRGVAADFIRWGYKTGFASGASERNNFLYPQHRSHVWLERKMERSGPENRMSGSGAGGGVCERERRAPG